MSTPDILMELAETIWPVKGRSTNEQMSGADRDTTSTSAPKLCTLLYNGWATNVTCISKCKTIGNIEQRAGTVPYTVITTIANTEQRAGAVPYTMCTTVGSIKSSYAYSVVQCVRQ